MRFWVVRHECMDKCDSIRCGHGNPKVWGSGFRFFLAFSHLVLRTGGPQVGFYATPSSA